MNKSILVLAATLISTSLFAQKSISGEIDGTEGYNPNDVYADEYTITIKQPRLLEVTLNSDTFDSYLMITKPDGYNLSNDDFEGRNSKISFLAEPGQYTIWAGSYSSDSRGEYELIYLKGDPIDIDRETGRLDESDPQLPKGEYYDEIKREIKIKGPFDIRLKAMGFSGYLSVISPSGVRYRSPDYYDESYTVVREIQPETGEWQIIVTSDYIGGTGAYDLEIIDFGKKAEAPVSKAIELD